MMAVGVGGGGGGGDDNGGMEWVESTGIGREVWVFQSIFQPASRKHRPPVTSNLIVIIFFTYVFTIDKGAVNIRRQ